MSEGQVADPTVPLPEEFTHLESEGYKAQKYGHTINITGPGLSTQIYDEIRGKQKHNESVAIVITGQPGKGKTYLAIRWGQKLDPSFHINDTPPPPPREDDGQVTFDREHIQYLVGADTPIKRTQVIVMDEFHFGGGSRSWQNKDQQKLVNLIAAIRSKGFVLIIVVLSTKMVDNYIRDFVLNYQFDVKDRGKAIAYRRWFPEGASEAHRKRLGKMEMRLPDQDLCNYDDCLKCRWLHASKDKRCETIRAIYERRKEHFLNEQAREEEEEAQQTTYTPFDEVIEKIRHDLTLLEWKNEFNLHRGKTMAKLKRVDIRVRVRDEPLLMDRIQDEFRGVK